MPVRKVSGGYQWGQHGKVYSDRAGAVRQAVAVFANGYHEQQNDTKKQQQDAKRAAVKNLIQKHGSNS